MKTRCGFTLIEMVVTLALVGLLGLVSLPLYEVTSTRVRESELRVALRQIRTALDAYKAAADSGLIASDPGASGYPPTLEALVEGVDNAADSRQPKLVFLRRLPRDPFATDSSVPAGQTWALRSYGSPPDDPQPGADIYDVASRSTRKGLNGIPYKDW
jgi:general secretion pathway protein G